MILYHPHILTPANSPTGDEQKPQCSQCRKGGRECRPSEGIVFRHQQNASMNTAAAAQEGRGDLKGFFSYKDSFHKDSVWLDIPKHGTNSSISGYSRLPLLTLTLTSYAIVIFVDNSDPYATDLESSLAESNALALAQSRNQRWGSDSRTSDADSHGMDSLSAVASQDRFPYSPHSLPDSMSYPSPVRSRASAMPPPTSPPLSMSSHNNTNINFLLNPANSLSPPVDPIAHPTGQRSASLPSRPAIVAAQRSVEEKVRIDGHAETDFEIAFLMRHYSEGPGLWYEPLSLWATKM